MIKDGTNKGGVAEGGGVAYIDWTVAKVSFLIFVMTQSDRLSGFLSILTLRGFRDYVHQAQVSRNEFQFEVHPKLRGDPGPVLFLCHWVKLFPEGSLIGSGEGRQIAHVVL